MKRRPLLPIENLGIENLGRMTPEEAEIFSEDFAKKLLADDDDGAAAKGHLAAGRAITYRDSEFPDDIMREWPDGRRELIDVDNNGNVTVLSTVDDNGNVTVLKT